MPSVSFKIPRKRISKISTKYNDARTAVAGPPLRLVARISGNLQDVNKGVKGFIRKKSRKRKRIAVKEKCQEIEKSLIALGHRIWIPSRKRTAKELKLTIFSISASSVGIGSAIVMGSVTPPALAGLVIAVPTMTQKVVKLHSLKERVGGYRRLFSLIRKQEVAVMILGGAAAGIVVLILCVGDNEFETVCNGLESALHSTDSLYASHLFDSVKVLHQNLVSSGPLKYTIAFADLLPNTAKDAFGVGNTPEWHGKLPASQYMAIGLLAAIAQLPAQVIIEEPGSRIFNRIVKRKVVWYKRRGLFKRHRR